MKRLTTAVLNDVVRLFGIAFLGAASLLACVGCTGARHPGMVGNGSTFVEPMMEVWTAEYQKATGTKVFYEAMGSGPGVARQGNRESRQGVSPLKC